MAGVSPSFVTLTTRAEPHSWSPTLMAAVNAYLPRVRATTFFITKGLHGRLTEGQSRARLEPFGVLCLRLWLRCHSKGEQRNRSPLKNGSQPFTESSG